MDIFHSHSGAIESFGKSVRDVVPKIRVLELAPGFGNVCETHVKEMELA